MQLIQLGAKTEAFDYFGNTPLFMASKQGHVETVKALLLMGAMVDGARWSDGAAPLHVAAQKGYTKVSIIKCQWSVLSILR